MARRAALMAFLPCLTGCSYLFSSVLGPPPPCHPGGELSPRPDLGVYELKQPEGAVDFSSDPKEVHIQPAKFHEDAWAATAIEKVKPYRAPTITADLTKGGSVLLCSFAVGNVPNIDGVDTPSGPLVSISTPDLIVWADFAGQKNKQRPRIRLHKSGVCFSSQPECRRSRAVRFRRL
ncbi:MAG: hypothetical protein IPK82_02940 [Polyangiaceae bacterium]|nr:hypothetical protein [Polyangiaceae bacterium]